MVRGNRPQPRQVTTPSNAFPVFSEDIKRPREAGTADRRPQVPRKTERPVSPNIQIYRPQLTSVLSIINRITGVVLSFGAVVLVVWLIAAASGPGDYSVVRAILTSWIGQLFLFCFTFSFFMHLCGGIRHLIWDTVHGFELRMIYLGGWLAVAASVALTIAAWTAGLLMAG
jgi:succinate dehydrogenase / fumarate reductase cytochrome b subunit